MKLAAPCEHGRFQRHVVDPCSGPCLIPQEHDECRGMREATADDLRALDYIKITDSDGLFDKTLCDALEVFLRERGVYPTKGGRVAPGDKTIGSEDVLEVLLSALTNGDTT